MPRRPPAGFGHIDMRVGPIDIQYIRVSDHGLGQIGMQVQTDRDGDLVAQGRPDAAQQLALAILEMLADHCAVEIQIDPVQGSGRRRRAQVFQQHRGNALKRILGDMGRRRRGGPAQRDDIRPGIPQGFERTGHRDMHAVDGCQHCFAPGKAGPAARPFERAEICLHRGECIGLMLKSANRDTRHFFASHSLFDGQTLDDARLLEKRMAALFSAYDCSRPSFANGSRCRTA